MNIEKVFNALLFDEMNSALGILCKELESQGYEIEIEGIQVKSEQIFENKLPSLEEVTEPLNIKLFRNSIEVQKFSIQFTEYHKINFREYSDK